MRCVVINTGTEILLGDVVNAHLAFIAREIFEFGLRLDEQRTISDGAAIAVALQDVFARAEIVGVDGLAADVLVRAFVGRRRKEALTIF